MENLVASRKIVVLGFDLREPLNAHPGPLWTQEQRSKFLIRPEARGPLSVDRAVWPSGTEVQNEQYPLYLWGSVTQILRASPNFVPGRSDSPVVIEIGAVTDAQSSQYWEDTFYGWLHPEEDTTVELVFQEFGYDVADRYLVSGLSNCMLSPEELRELRKNWAKRINGFGLFSKADEAVTYASVCDPLIPEHAPFFAYRIRRVEIKTGAIQLDAGFREIAISKP
jgi:hypothetical protein